MAGASGMLFAGATTVGANFSLLILHGLVTELAE